MRIFSEEKGREDVHVGSVTSGECRGRVRRTNEIDVAQEPKKVQQTTHDAEIRLSMSQEDQPSLLPHHADRDLDIKSRCKTEASENIPFAMPNSTDEERVPDGVHLAPTGVHHAGEVRVDLRWAKGVTVRRVALLNAERTQNKRQKDEVKGGRGVRRREKGQKVDIEEGRLSVSYIKQDEPSNRKPEILPKKKGKRTWRRPKPFPGTESLTCHLPLRRRCNLRRPADVERP